MKLKHINESVAPIELEDGTDVVAAVDQTFADEVEDNRKEATKKMIKKEMEQVDKQTNAVAKETCPKEKPAKVLEALEDNIPAEIPGDYDRLVKMMKSIRDIITCTNEDFIKAAREACRGK